MRNEVIAGLALFHAGGIGVVEGGTRGEAWRTYRGAGLVGFAMLLAATIAVAGAAIASEERRRRGLALGPWLRVALPYWVICTAGAFVVGYFPGGWWVGTLLMWTVAAMLIFMPAETVRTVRVVKVVRVQEHGEQTETVVEPSGPAEQKNTPA